MSHNIEFINNVAQMAYAGQTPWHKLGKKVPEDLTPEQMLKAAGLDWEVMKLPLVANADGVEVQTNRSALVRKTDNKFLDVVSDDWKTIQNAEAFEFFNEYVMAGDMSMETAGSLRDGQIVWGLAKVKDSFELFKGDVIESYLLFSNFHKYACSTDVRFTPTRVVCNNTLSMALHGKSERMIKVSHRKEFIAEDVKEMLGIATNKLQKYKEVASFLGSKKAKTESVVEYFERIFPMTPGREGEGKQSKNAAVALHLLETQPGHEYAAGTWWQPLNAVTFMTDHILGRSADSRLSSAWYGVNRTLKNRAVDLALEMADAA